MYEAMKAALRVAGLMAMALFIAHCGDSDVRVVTGDGVSPAAGTFTGGTGEGGTITIEVGSIESVTFDCEDEVISEIFSPPRPVNSDGTFSVNFTDAGRDFRVHGRFTDNNNGEGEIEDEDDDCDTTFDVARSGVVPATRTATPAGPVATQTPGPGGPTQTPGPGEPTLTPGGGATFTPGGGVETPNPTPTSTTAPAGCPVAFDFEGLGGTAPVLDAGWTGQGHDAQVISEGKLTFNVSCTATSPPCGTCPISGPIPNPNGANYTAMTGSDINPQRCSNDTSTVCTSNADCSGGTCSFYFGTYLPLAAGGVSTCVGNRVVGSVSGTVNVEAGSGAASIQLISQVFSGPTADEPCPKCTGDPTSNDGKRGGTCSGGQRSGQSCDINGASANVFFGATSLDCPPLSGGVIANLPINLSSTTGSLSRGITADSPFCTAPGFTTEQCLCDTCATQAAEPCASNADCTGGAVCGGRRCIGGGQAGKACTAASECPGGACGRAGAATKPNDCGDGVCGSNGECSEPFEQFCQPTAPHKGCVNDGECPAGNTCQGKFRRCFGATVNAQGVADPPVGGESDPTIAALFCIGPTSASAVNGVAGLPGLGRVEIPGHATQIF